MTLKHLHHKLRFSPFSPLTPVSRIFLVSEFGLRRIKVFSPFSTSESMIQHDGSTLDLGHFNLLSGSRWNTSHRQDMTLVQWRGSSHRKDYVTTLKRKNIEGKGFDGERETEENGVRRKRHLIDRDETNMYLLVSVGFYTGTEGPVVWKVGQLDRGHGVKV